MIKLEKKLEKAKKKIKDEVWKKLPDFDGYEVSSEGKIRSLSKVYYRTAPTKPDPNKLIRYERKPKELIPLYTGIDRRWTQIRLRNRKQGSYIQLSLAKLVISAFLNVSFFKLPRFIYFINWDSHDCSLNNLTFDRKKIGR